MSYMLKTSSFLGMVLNWFGVPGFIRPCEYKASMYGLVAGHLRCTVSVRVTDFYTIVTVNGVDVYFYRLTGEIDGVGGAPQDMGMEMAEVPKTTLE